MPDLTLSGRVEQKPSPSRPEVNARGDALVLDESNKIRSELTIEKWPAIWRPAKSKNKPVVKTLQREITQPDGTSKRARVEVGFTQLGNLTTEDQKTYYALTKIWEDNGRPGEFTYFSIRRLARVLKKRWGSDVIDATTESLRRLRTTPFTWTNSYRDSTTGREIEILDTFTLLSDLKIIRQKTDGHVTREAGYFRFNEMILKNLLANHTKPLLLDVILNFQSEIAQLLYLHLDLILARNEHYERRTQELFADLGLQGAAYRHASDRKRKLERALQELSGVPLSTGVLSYAAIERTKDRKDYKLVFHKTKRASLTKSRTETPRAEIGDRPSLIVANELPIKAQARELVFYFYKLFHGVTKPYPQPKEVSHAVSLIAAHGYDRARYIVNFSREAAERTNYAPQTFGGILQYGSRALADLECYERLRELGRQQLVKREAEEAEAEAEERQIDTALKSLSIDDYRKLYDTVRSDFTARYPSVMATRPQIFESAIRARMAAMTSGQPAGFDASTQAA